jgi:hypothetical protein
MSKIDLFEKPMKIAVFRCTVETESGKVNEVALLQLINILKERPKLICKTIQLIKERIDNPSPSTCCMAMILLAELMQQSGYDLHRQVMQTLLHRLMELAIRSEGVHPRIQLVALTLIRGWGVSYGTDPRLFEFADAARCISYLQSQYIEHGQ